MRWLRWRSTPAPDSAPGPREDERVAERKQAMRGRCRELL